MRDFSISLIRERSRGMTGPLGSSHPVVAFVDLLLIPGMVTANLLALGPFLTLLVRGGSRIPADQFIATSGFFSLAIGALAVAVSVVMTRLRPTVRLWVKLSV
jgi:hypothetical protein